MTRAVRLTTRAERETLRSIKRVCHAGLTRSATATVTAGSEPGPSFDPNLDPFCPF